MNISSINMAQHFKIALYLGEIDIYKNDLGKYFF